MTDRDDEDVTADSGVKVVGAPPPPPGVDTPSARSTSTAGSASVPMTKRARRVLLATAVLGVVGTIVFAILFITAKSPGAGTTQDPAVHRAATAFLTDFFNFDAKSVDKDFSAITAMATGSFSNQANQFFNSAIRTQLEKALAESRGQIRLLYVQSENEAQTAASVYAVIDQVYVNSKIATPQSDVVRLIVDMKKIGSTWKISNVSVLEGPNPASAGSASGSAGSTVPGQ